MKPLFSVILTTYNRSHFLSRAIRSVLQQIFTDFELIIVDDHSTDNTKQIVAGFSDSKITYIQQTHNQGVSTARNMGIHHATGEYICFLDDDDEFLPQFLQEIAIFLKQKKPSFLGMICVGVAKVYAPNNLAKKKEIIKTELFNVDNKNLSFLLHLHLLSGITFHRSCFHVNAFNSELQIAEDIDFVLSLLEKGIAYAAIPKILINIHIHEQTSLSRSVDLANRIKNLELFLRNHDKFLKQNLPLWLCWQTNLLGDYYHMDKKQQARKLILRICKKKWFSPKVWELFLRFELLKPLQVFFSKVSAKK